MHESSILNSVPKPITSGAGGKKFCGTNSGSKGTRFSGVVQLHVPQRTGMAAAIEMESRKRYGEKSEGVWANNRDTERGIRAQCAPATAMRESIPSSLGP